MPQSWPCSSGSTVEWFSPLSFPIDNRLRNTWKFCSIRFSWAHFSASKAYFPPRPHLPLATTWNTSHGKISEVLIRNHLPVRRKIFLKGKLGESIDFSSLTSNVGQLHLGAVNRKVKANRTLRSEPALESILRRTIQRESALHGLGTEHICSNGFPGEALRIADSWLRSAVHRSRPEVKSAAYARNNEGQRPSKRIKSQWKPQSVRAS